MFGARVANHTPNYFGNVLVGFVKGLNLNQTGDVVIQFLDPYSNITFRRITVTNASINPTTCRFGIFTGAGGGGNTVVAGSTSLSQCPTTKCTALTIASPSTTDVQAANCLYFNLTTGQGAAATIDIYVYGDVIA